MIKYLFKAVWIGMIILSSQSIHSQILTFDHGEVEFYTSSILSDIEASTEEVEASLNLETKAVEIKIAIESFEFEYEMMQDHFNAEYMESEKYPYASFKGQVAQDLSNTNELTELDVTGTLSIHGVDKDITFKASVSNKEGFFIVKCKFPIVFKDFNVEEPSVLTKSVAKDVDFKGTLYLK